MYWEKLNEQSTFTYIPELESMMGVYTLLQGEKSHQLCTNLYGAEQISIWKEKYCLPACGIQLSVILASGVFPVLQSAAMVAIGFVIGGIVFDVDFSNLNVGLVALTILCAMISATCFGLFLAIFGLISDSMHLVLNVVSGVLLIFTGAEFPVSQLPVAGQMVSRMIPLTHSLQAMNLLFGNDRSSFWMLLGTELFIVACYIFAAWSIFGMVERAARRGGRFDIS